MLVASSNMRGVREGYLHRVKRIGLEDSLPSIRPPRATYTEPLPPLRHVPQAPHRLGALDMAVLGGLQALAASLLRLSSKPSIALLLDAQHAQRPPRPPPLPKLSSYAQSMERSRRAYAPTTPVQVHFRGPYREREDRLYGIILMFLCVCVIFWSFYWPTYGNFMVILW